MFTEESDLVLIITFQCYSGSCSSVLFTCDFEVLGQGSKAKATGSGLRVACECWYVTKDATNGDQAYNTHTGTWYEVLGPGSKVKSRGHCE